MSHQISKVVQWEWMSYADGIFIAVEIIHSLRSGEWEKVLTKFAELNPLQAVYVFAEAQKQLANDNPELLKLLVNKIGFEMNSINGQ